MNDLREVIKSLAVVKVSELLGYAQPALLNPIGEALTKRIEDAIFGGLPFHVYMVLPVHPESTLNTLNIMTQIHLTKQSVIFGEHSFVNRVRRAIAAMNLVRDSKISVNMLRSVLIDYL